MLGEISLVESVNNKDLEEAIEEVKKHSSIVDTMVLFPFEHFLSIVFGYIYHECQKEQVDEKSLESIVARAAEAINGTENSLADTSSKESDKLEKLVRDYLSDHNKPDDDVFDFGVSRKLEIDFKDELSKFFRTPGLSKVSKRQIMQYIFSKSGIIDYNDVPIPSYSEDDFINNLINKKIQGSFPIYFDDVVGTLRGVIDEEKEALKKRNLSAQTELDYNSQYPGLSKALLLIDIKAAIKQLKQEYNGKTMFTGYLQLFLSLLSQYDVQFTDSFKISVPVSEFRDGIKTILKREMHANKDFNLKKSQIIKQSVYSRLDMENNGISGKISFREMYACIPDDFKRRLYDGYRDGKSNLNAILLAKAMSQYCVSSKGKKFTPKQIDDALYNVYCQELEKLSEELEKSSPDYDTGTANQH